MVQDRREIKHLQTLANGPWPEPLALERVRKEVLALIASIPLKGQASDGSLRCGLTRSILSAVGECMLSAPYCCFTYLQSLLEQ